MKILHTSDWHLGHRLLEQSQQEEQALFLGWLINYITSNGIDVLLIAGDIFDVGVPSAQAQKMYYDFLIQLHRTSCREVIITGGNHDAPSTLNAPKELLNAFSIRVVGKATEDVADEIFNISVGTENLMVAAVPFLRDQDIRRAIASETGEEIINRYKSALVSHYTDIASACQHLAVPGTKIIAMGHLFAIGGKTSESEQSIYVGNLGDIGAGDFPETFDYVALGHLHKAQSIGGKENIRYSGSPFILSFSEVGQEKKVVEIETGEHILIKEVTVPAFRKIVQIKGTVDECKLQLEALDIDIQPLVIWVEVILTDEKEAALGYREIFDYAKSMKLEVLKVTVKDDRKFEHLKSLVDSAQQVRTFTPLEVFRLKCEEQNLDLNENRELLDAFNEILQLVHENDKV
jgi:DNA repair protein SbcD/Mre11